MIDNFSSGLILGLLLGVFGAGSLVLYRLWRREQELSATLAEELPDEIVERKPE
jgi:hypothetical protein